MDFNTSDQIFTYFESSVNLEKGLIPFDKRNYRLDRMRLLAARLGNPQNQYPLIHLAGSKGKGSTGAFISSILSAAGLKTGFYSSPHVSDYRERFTIDGCFATEYELLRAGRTIIELAQSVQGNLPGEFTPTTFELLTLFGFLLFAQCGCQAAVIETGIGGRLDATNIVNPIGCVITPLDLEHTKILGSTYHQIAREKGGIIKPGVPVFSNNIRHDVRTVLKELAGQNHSPFYELHSLCRYQAQLRSRNMLFSLRHHKTRFSCRLRMLGTFQAENAATAWLTVHTLFPHLDETQIRRGLEAASLPGRFEIAGESPLLVLDSAHTPLAVRKLVRSFKQLTRLPGILLFGSVADKDHIKMAALLCPHFSHIIVSKPGTFKQSNPAEVWGCFVKKKPTAILEMDPQKALAKALELSRGKYPILVTGSFYMTSVIKREISSREVD